MSLHAGSFTLAPPRIELTVRPGAVENVTLTVLTNPGEAKEQKMFFRFYIVDFKVDGKGQVEFFEAGSLKRSASPWLNLDFREFEMLAGDKRTVGLTIKVPSATSGGYYSAIILEELPVAQLIEKKPLVHTVRMVALVELTLQGRGRLRQDAVISSIDIGRVGEQRRPGFVVTVENRGNVHLKGKGDLIVRTKHGGPVATLPLEAGRGTVFPEASREFSAILDRSLASGNYVAEAVIRHGIRGRAVARFPFAIAAGQLVAAGQLEADKEIKVVVDPYWVDISARAGAFRTVPILIENEDDSPIHVSSGVLGVTFDMEGRLVVSEGSGSKWSCVDWIEVEPAEFDLQPGARRRVITKVSIPRDAAGGRAAQVDFVASTPKTEGAEPLETSSGTTLIITIMGGLDLKAEITSLNVTESKSEAGMNFEALFRNNGNAPVAPKGKLVIRSLDGPGTPTTQESGAGQQASMIGEIELDEILGVVLPEGTRRLRAAYPAMLNPGRYSAEIIIHYGADDPATAQREFDVK